MRKLLLTIWLAVFLVPSARSQDEEKIQQLFQDAIQAMGGDAYLEVTDMESEGQYFQFNAQGDSSGLIKFSDYTKLPDKSRFELGNRKKELEITVFNLEKNEGWILEGQKETRAATEEEMKEFRNEAKHSIDTIFRFRYKDPENKLFYLGPGEGQDMMDDLVKLVDTDNDEVTIYFDRISKLPAKIEYRTVNKKGIRQRNVDEFSQWHVIQGVNTPMRTDAYVNGRQSSQLFVLKITYNNNLPDSFFSKPVPPK
jgi:outer membrane lipoprotein-sorting protein